MVGDSRRIGIPDARRGQRLGCSAMRGGFVDDGVVHGDGVTEGVGVRAGVSTCGGFVDDGASSMVAA
nr:unnamed protein product [Digitaria exilis]